MCSGEKPPPDQGSQHTPSCQSVWLSRPPHSLPGAPVILLSAPSRAQPRGQSSGPQHRGHHLQHPTPRAHLALCAPQGKSCEGGTVWFLLCTPPHQPSTEPGSRQPQHRTPWTQAGRDGTVHAPPHAHARTLRGQATSPPRETSRPHLLHLLNSGPERPAGPTERSASEVSEPCLTSAQWPHPLHREQPGLFLYYF